MTQLDFAAITKELEIQKAHVVTELNTIAKHNHITDDWEVTMEDEEFGEADDDLLSDNAEEADERFATLALLETKYRNINLALKKIPTGSYGICEICDENIEAARLQANPSARTCIAHIDDEAFLPLA